MFNLSLILILILKSFVNLGPGVIVSSRYYKVFYQAQGTFTSILVPLKKWFSMGALGNSLTYPDIQASSSDDFIILKCRSDRRRSICNSRNKYWIEQINGTGQIHNDKFHI